MLRPKPVMVALTPIEAWVAAVVLMYALLVVLMYQNNRLLHRLVWLHEPMI